MPASQTVPSLHIGCDTCGKLVLNECCFHHKYHVSRKQTFWCIKNQSWRMILPTDVPNQDKYTFTIRRAWWKWARTDDVNLLNTWNGIKEQYMYYFPTSLPRQMSLNTSQEMKLRGKQRTCPIFNVFQNENVMNGRVFGRKVFHE